MYAKRLIYILTIYCKCLLFQFLGCDIRMQIPILTGVQKRTHLRLKNGHTLLLKNVVLNLHFLHEGHVDVIFLIYILTVHRESLL